MIIFNYCIYCNGLGQDGIWDPYEAPDNLQIVHIECVSLTISCPLFFSASLKFRACYITVHWVNFLIKFSFSKVGQGRGGGGDST